ncbi:hypothetical protein Anapl_02502 [Anas platyrhynchos]|uniref:Uncharacterized protein n=1 Tax=Anas platyrhynchos TaxID=8839 RepID=R0L4W9_ANAPL|nr:hypothetical protein Anapl_02502 [Anas platyrhynchos]
MALVTSDRGLKTAARKFRALFGKGDSKHSDGRTMAPEESDLLLSIRSSHFCMAVTCGLIPDAPPQGQGWDQPAQRGTDPAAWGGGWAAACSADVCNALAVPCKARRYTDTHDEVARALGKHQDLEIADHLVPLLEITETDARRQTDDLQESFLSPNKIWWQIMKASSYSKDKVEHVKHCTENDRTVARLTRAERDTCSKAINVVKATFFLAETCDEVPC